MPLSFARRAARRLRRIVRGGAIALPDSVTTAEDASNVVRLDYPRHTVRLVATSPMERTWRARACKKEPWTVAWLEESVREGTVLYDIGANVGTFALIGAKLSGPRGTVVAFEPGFATYAHLCSNVVLNGCQSIVIPVPLALGSASGLGSFAYRSLDPGQSRHQFRQERWVPADSDRSDQYRQPMLTMTLDEVVRTFALPQPDHIKIDVDGGEIEVLDGASRTLDGPRLKSILIEVDEALTGAATDRLARSGFTLDRRHERPRGEHASSHVWYGVFRRSAAAP